MPLAREDDCFLLTLASSVLDLGVQELLAGHSCEPRIVLGAMSPKRTPQVAKATQDGNRQVPHFSFLGWLKRGQFMHMAPKVLPTNAVCV